MEGEGAFSLSPPKGSRANSTKRPSFPTTQTQYGQISRLAKAKEEVLRTPLVGTAYPVAEVVYDLTQTSIHEPYDLMREIKHYMVDKG